MNEEVNNKLDSILKQLNENARKLENLEKGLVSVNTDLIAQNIKFSNKVLGNVPVPDEIKSSSPQVEKELFYSESNGRINIHGPGTFDNKDLIKGNGNWDSFSKSWNMNISLDKILELFPKIVNKDLH